MRAPSRHLASAGAVVVAAVLIAGAAVAYRDLGPDEEQVVGVPAFEEATVEAGDLSTTHDLPGLVELVDTVGVTHRTAASETSAAGGVPLAAGSVASAVTAAVADLASLVGGSSGLAAGAGIGGFGSGAALPASSTSPAETGSTGETGEPPTTTATTEPTPSTATEPSTTTEPPPSPTTTEPEPATTTTEPEPATTTTEPEPSTPTTECAPAPTSTTTATTSSTTTPEPPVPGCPTTTTTATATTSTPSTTPPSPGPAPTTPPAGGAPSAGAAGRAGGAGPSGSFSGGVVTDAGSGGAASGGVTLAEPERFVVTGIAPTGSVVEAGDVVYSADGEPVVAMDGTVPAWRSLSTASADGVDVEQLERNLVELGYDPDGAVVVDRTFTEATEAAVEAWQEGLGLEPTGEVELGRAVFLPASATVTAHQVEVGEQVEQDGEVLTLATATRQVVVDVPDELQSVVLPGLQVEVSTGTGDVAGVVGVLRAGTDEDTGEVTVQAIVSPDGDLGGAVAGSEVRVEVPVVGASGVLTVPTEAVASRLDGSYAVQLVDEGGARSWVEVDVLGTGGQRTAVRGPGIAEGATVIVPT
jgi:hypothetical protein